MSERRLGWLADPEDDRDFRAGLILDSAPPAPPAATLRPYAHEPLDQGPLNSCVAHAVAQAVYVCSRRAGFDPVPLLSRLWLYWVARNYHAATLIDEGTYIRLAMRALSKLGFCPEAVWPYLQWEVAVQPSRAAFRSAYDMRTAGYYRIDSRGANRVDDVRRAVAAGYPVVFGAGISRAMTGWDGVTALDPPRPLDLVGGHAMVVLEYDERELRGPGSWGTAYGRDGWFAITPDYMASPLTQDVWAIEAVPELEAA